MKLIILIRPALLKLFLNMTKNHWDIVVFFLSTKPMEGSLVVVFNTYKVNTNDVVYPSITLPPSRCECDNDILGHYFYLLVDQLYHMTAF